MMAVDTNVVVRLVMRDDEAQWRAAMAFFEENHVLLTICVLMETEWVLRKSYKLTRNQICEGLEKLCGSRSVILENDTGIGEAIADYRRGFDLADALHVRQAQRLGAARFATFDTKLARSSRRRDWPIAVFIP